MAGNRPIGKFMKDKINQKRWAYGLWKCTRREGSEYTKDPLQKPNYVFFKRSKVSLYDRRRSYRPPNRRCGPTLSSWSARARFLLDPQTPPENLRGGDEKYTNAHFVLPKIQAAPSGARESRLILGKGKKAKDQAGKWGTQQVTLFCSKWWLHLKIKSVKIRNCLLLGYFFFLIIAILKLKSSTWRTQLLWFSDSRNDTRRFCPLMEKSVFPNKKYF